MEGLAEIKALSSELAKEKTKTSINFQEKTFTFEDLSTLDVPPITWLVENIIQNPGLVAISGKPGSYKTMFSLWLMARVAGGERAFHSYHMPSFNVPPLEPEPTGVLFIEEEMSERQMKERVNNIVTSRNAKEKMFYRIASGLKLSNLQHIEEMYTWCVQHDVKLIFLDPFSSVAGMKDENDNAEASTLMDTVRTMLVNRGITVVVIHHPAKTNDGSFSLRGAGDLLGKLDTHIVLEKNKEKEEIIVHFAKTRDVDERKIWDFRMKFEAEEALGRSVFNYMGRYDGDKS